MAQSGGPLGHVVYGVPLPDAPVVEVPADLAWLFADAHHRLTGEAARAHLGDGAFIDHGPRSRVARPDDPIVEALAGAERATMLVGPGVVAAGAVGGLHAFAEAGGLGVLNTWGAKGVFDWRSPHHLATVGLQARDLELGGLAGADLIVASGIDELEAGPRWRLAPVVEVAPEALGDLAARLTASGRAIEVPPLRAGLADVTQRGWEATTAPLPPTKVTQHYAQVLGEGGLVAADPGVAGFWVARTFPTTRLGGAQVPSRPDAQGFAVACATVARLLDPSRAVLAVVDRVDDATAAALATAARLGVTVPVEVWAADGDALDAEAHLARLHDRTGPGGIAAVATDPHQLDEIVAVAGPIVAWGGLP